MARRIAWLVVVAIVAVAGCSQAVPPPSATGSSLPPPVDASSPSPIDSTNLSLAAEIRGAARIDEQHGWVMTASGLAFTDDGGSSWRATTPADAAAQVLMGATFADPDHGWLATAVPDPRATTFDIWRTHDEGRSWDRAVVPEGINRGDLVGTLTFAVAGSGHLFAMIDGGMPTGYTGDLFASADAGASWTPVPIHQDAGVTGPIAFADARHGVVAGGAPGDRLFSTDDGGRTWRQAVLPPPIGAAGSSTQFWTAPTFWTNRQAGEPVWFGNTERATTLGILLTEDGGATWQPRGSVPLGADQGSAVAALIGPSTWVVILSPSGGARTDDAGTTWTPFASTGLPVTPDVLSMVDSTHGWAIVRVSGCEADKTDCQTRSAVFATDDGGATWSLIWPPPS